MALGRLVIVLAHILYRKVSFECFQKFLRGLAVEVFHNAVIVQNGQFVSCEASRKEIIIFFVSFMVRIGFLTLLSHANCSCRTMVTICNIQVREERFNCYSRSCCWYNKITIEIYCYSY